MNKIIKSFIIILCCAYISSCYNAIDASFKEENNSGSFLLSPTISTSFSSLNSESTGVNGSEGLEYEYDDSNYTCTLVGVGTFKGEKLIIPSKVNVNEKNYTVTEIEVFSFSNLPYFHCKSLGYKA